MKAEIGVHLDPYLRWDLVLGPAAAHFSQLAVAMDPGATHEHSDDAGGAA